LRAVCFLVAVVAPRVAATRPKSPAQSNPPHRPNKAKSLPRQTTHEVRSPPAPAEHCPRPAVPPFPPALPSSPPCPNVAKFRPQFPPCRLLSKSGAQSVRRTLLTLSSRPPLHSQTPAELPRNPPARELCPAPNCTFEPTTNAQTAQTAPQNAHLAACRHFLPPFLPPAAAILFLLQSSKIFKLPFNSGGKGVFRSLFRAVLFSRKAISRQILYYY
jgi:hypothetical protein